MKFGIGSTRARTKVSTPSTRRGKVTAIATMTLLVSAAGGFAAGPAAYGTSLPSVKTEILRIGLNGVALPDPAKATVVGNWAAIQFSLAYAPIFHLGPNGTIAPALATSWHYVNTGATGRNKVFEFTLRSDARFSDGTYVTAQDVVGWLQHFTQAGAVWGGIFGTHPSFTALSATQVRIAMNTSNPDLPLEMSDEGLNAGFVVGPKALAHSTLLASGTDGAGPYMMVPSQTVPGDHYTYVPNPYYYDKSAVRFTQVDVKVINNPASMLEAMEAGQLDFALGDASTALSAESANFKVVESALGVRYFALNTIHDVVPALRDVRVRQAINYAIDRQAIAYALFGKFGIPISSFNPADVNFGMNNYYPFDPAKARSLLAAAGYKDGFTINGYVQGAYLGNLGQPLMEAVAQDLQAVGIKLNITPYPTDPEYATAVFSYKASVVDLATAGTYTPPIYSLFVAPKGAVNFYGTDPVIAKLYNEGLTANNPTPYWKEMWERFTTQAYTVPLLLSPLFFYSAKTINGVAATSNASTALPTEWSPAS